MRLIDADAVHATILQAFSDGHDDPTGKLLGDLIDEAPTITPPPNAPLTLEELREMDEEPVYIIDNIEPKDEFWAIWDDGWKSNWLEDRENYGKTWLAYRRRPEEGAT